MSWFGRLARWARESSWRWRHRPYRARFVDERLPKRLKRRMLYIVQEDGFQEYAAMVCPCGCGDVLHMNLLPDERPCWTFTRHENETASLHPSVWRTKNCGAHFFLRRGEIQWCNADAD